MASTEALRTAHDDASIRENGGSQFLSFILAGEHYGIDILRVQEIKGWTAVTRVPRAPAFMKGVLNLRGTVVPIVDMRIRFSLEEVEYTALTVVIVLSVKSENRERMVGIVVDAVSDVLNVAKDEIKETPDFGTVVDTEFIHGLATMNDKMVMLLDVDHLLDMDCIPSDISVHKETATEVDDN